MIDFVGTPKCLRIHWLVAMETIHFRIAQSFLCLNDNFLFAFRGTTYQLGMKYKRPRSTR